MPTARAHAIRSIGRPGRMWPGAVALLIHSPALPWCLRTQNVDGVHKTLQGADLTVTGFGNNLRVNNASVVCGGVQTANATVYLIDTVLTPPDM